MKYFDLELIRKKKQKNVAEQNALTKDNVSQCAQHFIENRDLPQALISYFEQHGLNTYQSLLVERSCLPCGGWDEAYTGKWITQDEKFYSYDIIFDKRKSRIVSVDLWQNVTDDIEISNHKPGTGKTFGSLCIELLHELEV